jgi:hypothetical protein
LPVTLLFRGGGTGGGGMSVELPGTALGLGIALKAGCVVGAALWRGGAGRAKSLGLATSINASGNSSTIGPAQPAGYCTV